jgi:hypothetical protein
VEVDEFMCGKDGKVVEEVSKREVRSVYGFWGGCSSVSFGRPAVEVALGGGVVAAAASFAAVLLAVSKVFRWSRSMSQVGWEVVRGDNVVLACFAALLSSRGCASWYSQVSSGAWTLLTGSQVLLLSGYPFHLIRYWSLQFRHWWARITSISYCSSPSIMSGGGRM